MLPRRFIDARTIRDAIAHAKEYVAGVRALVPDLRIGRRSGLVVWLALRFVAALVFIPPMVALFRPRFAVAEVDAERARHAQGPPPS